MKKIQIIGNGENRDNGFYSLIHQKTTFHCLEYEIYFISEIALEKLKKDKIKFKILNE